MPLHATDTDKSLSSSRSTPFYKSSSKCEQDDPDAPKVQLVVGFTKGLVLSIGQLGKLLQLAADETKFDDDIHPENAYVCSGICAYVFPPSATKATTSSINSTRQASTRRSRSRLKL